MFDLPPPRHISTLRNSVVRHVLAKDGSATLCRLWLSPSEDESRTAAEGTMSGRARLPSGKARQAYQRRSRRAAPAPSAIEPSWRPVISTTDLVAPATVSGRVVTPPATPFSQSESWPAAKLTVQLDQLRRGAFDHVAVVHDPGGSGEETTVRS